MTAAVIKESMVSTNVKITFASMIISIFPLFFVCPLAERYCDIIISAFVTVMVPLSIYILMLMRFINSGYISNEENKFLFVFNLLISIMLLATSSTLVYLIINFRLN